MDCDFPALVQQAGYPGTQMIPAPQALLSILALKLISTERKSHVMDLVFDEGLALFAGLNVPPKTTALATYSHSLAPRMNERFRQAWVRTLRDQKLLGGNSFNLDFHSIPFFGTDEFVERHYLSKRSRSQKSILVFLAQEADSQVICYSHADVLKREQVDEVMGFVEFWRKTYGRLPAELVFDSRLTTYKNLSLLNQRGITFMTLQRRSPTVLRAVANAPRSAWRTVHLDLPHRMYQNPRVIDRQVPLRDYQGVVRQLLITDLGHEQRWPTPCCWKKPVWVGSQRCPGIKLPRNSASARWKRCPLAAAPSRGARRRREPAGAWERVSLRVEVLGHLCRRATAQPVDLAEQGAGSPEAAGGGDGTARQPPHRGRDRGQDSAAGWRRRFWRSWFTTNCATRRADGVCPFRSIMPLCKNSSPIAWAAPCC